MPRTTGDTTIDNEILTRLQGKNFRSRVEIDYWDGSDWVLEDSVSGEDDITWTDNTKRTKYADFGIQPTANTIEYVIENRDGRFCPGSGETEENRYDIDTKIRIRHIYPSETQYITDENRNLLTDEYGKELVIKSEYTLYYSVFYVDDVTYNVNGTNTDVVIITGRDAYKYALEKKIILPDLSAGVTIDELIKTICDEIGIAYTTDSISDLSAFGNRTLATGLNEPKTADEMFETLMAIINQSDSDGYQMYLAYDDDSADNVLFVQEIPSLYETNFSFTENEIIGVGSFKKDRTRFLQRITCVDEKQTPNEREQLATATYTTNGQKTLTFSKDSLYVVYTVVINSGTPTVVLDQKNNGSLVFTISDAGSVTITAYGPGFNTFPTLSGEAIGHDNMVNNIGQTIEIESLLFESDDECRKTAEGLVSKYASPDKQANDIVYPYCNTYLVNNDMVYPFIRNIFDTDLYYIVGIRHSWSFFSESTSFDIEDSGLNWEDVYDGFIYDGALYDTGLDLEYDIGIVYDMDFGPNEKPESILAQTRAEYIYDIGEA